MKATTFEVDCYNAVSTNQVILKNAKGEKFSAPVISLRWRNSFYADVTFSFRGQEFTVCAEVHPEYGDY